RPWFPNPTNAADKVFAFADAPHLLKLIRNHLLDSGLVVNEQLLTPRTIADVINHTSASDVSITFKLNDDHLTVKGAERQKVKLAAQLFSNTTANAIRRCFSLGLDVYQATETADFIQLVNDWFDILNSTLSTFVYPGKEPFGHNLATQIKKLDEITKIMASPIIPNKKVLEPFQRGVVITNKALIMLHEYVGERFNMQYICTSRLNQDVLEHFFGALRSKGGLNDHPSPKDFKYRMRKYILARNTEHLSGTGNVGYDTTEWLSTSDTNVSFIESETKLSNEPLELEEISEEPLTNVLDDLDGSNFDDMGTLQVDALEYIAGYTIRKLKLREYESQKNSYTWVDQVSKGMLIKPSSEFLEQLKKLEAVFYTLNGLEISHCDNIHQRLVERSNNIDLPDVVKCFFFKCRIYFRIRHLNQRLKKQKWNKEVSKKMLKIKL
uniref:P element homolog (Lu-P2 element) n=1 Tax=Lucilia cuprina TaxID=7375 RepID=Q7M4J7_LUCCU